jgi:hypothetical protein
MVSEDKADHNETTISLQNKDKEPAGPVSSKTKEKTQLSAQRKIAL